MHIVFMGSPYYAVGILQSILALEHEVVGVYTQPDKPVGRGRSMESTPIKTYALSQNLRVFEPASLRVPEAQQEMADLKPDVMIVAAYGKLLPPPVLHLPQHGCLNVHPSLLPCLRGPSPVATAILQNVEPTGTTLMLLDAGMDTGPILASQELRGWTGSATMPDLTEKLFRLGEDMLPDVLPRWLDGRIEPQPQEHSLATITRRLEKADGKADWSLPAVDLERRCRAFTPWPGLHTTWKGKVVKLLSTVVTGMSSGPAGLVVAEEGAEIGVSTGQGVLGIASLQMEGKRPLGAGEFLRGYPDFLGSVLPS